MYCTPGRRRRKHVIWDDLVLSRYGAHGKRYWTKWDRRAGKAEAANWAVEHDRLTACSVLHGGSVSRETQDQVSP